MNRKKELELEREIYKESYYEFFKMAFAQLHPNSPYDDNWHIEFLCNVLQKEFWRIHNRVPREKDIIINIPFRSAKSLIATVIWPVWCWTIDPGFKFITVSYSTPLATEHSFLSKDLILSNWFQELYGDLFEIRFDASGKQFYKNTKGGFRKAVGTGGAITGSGSSVIIGDDLLDPKRAASEVERKNAIDFYSHTLYNRLNEPDIGSRIIIMQRLHQYDIAGYLLETRPNDHYHINIPGEITDETRDEVKPSELLENYENGSFWNSRFNARVVSGLKGALGTVQFEGQFNQRTSPPEGNIIKKAWFQISQPERLQRDPDAEPIHFYIDSAYTEKKENDPTAIVACYKKGKNLVVVNIEQVWLEFHELTKYIQNYVRLHGYSGNSKIKIEPKASGKSIVQQLKDSTNLNIMEAKTPKDDKITRLNSISPIVETGRVTLIENPWNYSFLSQICAQPNASHWDMTDAFVMAVDDLLQQDGFDFMFI